MTITTQRPATWAAVEAAQHGDMDAFAHLYRTYYDAVFVYIYRRVPSRATSEDLAHDVFAKALRHIGSVEYRGSDIGAWLHVLTRNRLLDYWKSHHTQRSKPVDITNPESPYLNHAAPSWLPNHEEVVIQAETAAWLRAVVARLTDDQRQVIELRFFADMSIAETAAAMGKNTGAVKALTHRAMCALRHLLDGAEVR